MDLEKLASRVRSTLLAVCLVGVLIAGFGALLTATVINHVSGKPGGFWVDALGSAAGPMSLAAAGAMIACLPWAIWPLTSLLLRRAQDGRYRAEQLMGTMETQRQLLEGLRETSSLSDAAKQIAYRAKDLEMLRQAIREDMGKQDFEAATILADETERRFGYGKEADRWRTQINATSGAAIEARVRETVEHVESLVSKYEWPMAIREADRLRKQFPDHLEAQRLRDRVDSLRDAHKREILQAWKEAIAKDDLDASVLLLKQLDQYLSPSEAEVYKDNARDVFRKRLQQLHAEFKLHVHDKNWVEALRTGRQITSEFPNTRSAAEVRDRLDILQTKAQQPLAV